MSEPASEPANTRINNPSHPETHAAPQAPTRGEAPARGKWGRDSPMLGGVTGGVIPPGKAQCDATRAECAPSRAPRRGAATGRSSASPIGTIPVIGARLARATFAPDLMLSDGEATFVAGCWAVGEPASGPAEGWVPYRAMFDILAGGKRHVMMGLARSTGSATSTSPRSATSPAPPVSCSACAPRRATRSITRRATGFPGTESVRSCRRSMSSRESGTTAPPRRVPRHPGSTRSGA